MKTLINNSISDKLIPEDMGSDYKGCIKYCLKFQPQGGYTFDVMEKYSRISKALDASGDDSIEFEDQDAETLKGIINKVAFAVFHADIHGFMKAVKEL